jgi:DNA recombination protein RmuC
MGFRTLAIQKKSSEVWQLLSATKVEFQNFGTLMAAVEKQVGTVQNTIKKVNSKTRTINRRLKDVEVLEMSPPSSPILDISEPDSDFEREDLLLEADPANGAAEDEGTGSSDNGNT